MVSDTAYWLLAVPLENHDPHAMYSSLASKLGLTDSSSSSNNSASSSSLVTSMGQITFPPFKTGTLQSLIALSDELPKHDGALTALVLKLVDTLKALLNNDADSLTQHLQVNESPLDQYVTGNWTWNATKFGRVGNDRSSLAELMEKLVKEMNSIDSVMKQKLQAYNLAKSQLQALQRKKV